MRLYHGSNVEIQAIDLSKSRPFKDFGKAFYLSADKNQAFEMGQSKAALFGGNPVISIFEFDESIMSSSELKVKVFEQYDKEWADFIFASRNKKNKDFSHGYDIVYGPTANDSVGNQVFRYKEGYISFDNFINNLKHKGGITFQYAFCSENAIAKLKKL